MFNIVRLELARQRRRLTAKALAERAGISAVTLSRIVNALQIPDENTVRAIASALEYPIEFFFLDDVDTIATEAASFRSLSSMSARERDAALSAGVLAFEVLEWVKSRFELPANDLIDLSQQRDPSNAARLMRQYWAIGEKPINHMINLLETKGVRVFSLSEDTKNVDAFSCWRNGEAFVFLNTFKSAERSRFDAAHELGHLVLHRHGGPQGREAEIEANAFASSFLMPHDDLISQIPYVSDINQIVTSKKRWGVAAVALAYRLHKLGRMTEWQYIQINRHYRTAEPDGIVREKSAVWEMVLRELWKEGLSKEHIARDLKIPLSELEGLLFGLTAEIEPPSRNASRTQLKVVQ